MNRMLLWLSAAILSLWASSCQKDGSGEAYPLNEDVVLNDVAYGSHERQKMDIFLPAGRNRNTTGLLVFIHGGGWIAGSKDDLGFDLSRLQVWKERFPDMALITLNYQLVTGSQNRYPAAEEDVIQAMDYVYKNLTNYGLSSDICMSGGSAGAHLAALYSLKHNPERRVKGCIGISGAYDLNLLYETGNSQARQLLEMFLGGSPSQVPHVYQQASPIHFVTAQAPKFLLLHGNDDPLTPLSQAGEMIDKFEQLDIPYHRFEYDGGHGIPAEHEQEAIMLIQAFLAE